MSRFEITTLVLWQDPQLDIEDEIAYNCVAGIETKKGKKGRVVECLHGTRLGWIEATVNPPQNVYVNSYLLKGADLRNL